MSISGSLASVDSGAGWSLFGLLGWDSPSSGSLTGPFCSGAFSSFGGSGLGLGFKMMGLQVEDSSCREHSNVYRACHKPYKT